MRSGFERALATQLKMAGVPFGYETTKLPYTVSHVYNPDFTLPNGILIEAKGRFMKGDTQKMKAVKQAHPDLDIRFVFMDAHKRIPGQKQTHAQWADRHGFPWASGKIPEEWFK